jgi:hypothetical protein
MQANFHILLGEVEYCGCLCSAQFVDVPQHDHSAVLVRKVKHGFLQKMAKFSEGRSLFRIKRRLDNIHRTFFVMLGVLELVAAVAKAEAPQCFVDRNARQPYRERRVSGKLVEVLICPNVGILYDVFRFGIVAQDAYKPATGRIGRPVADRKSFNKHFEIPLEDKFRPS